MEIKACFSRLSCHSQNFPQISGMLLLMLLMIMMILIIRQLPLFFDSAALPFASPLFLFLSLSLSDLGLLAVLFFLACLVTFGSFELWASCGGFVSLE